MTRKGRAGAVQIRPVNVTDYDAIYRWSVAPSNFNRWRYRGATPSPDHVMRQLWEGVTSQFCVVPDGQPQPVALVGLYNANHVSGYAYLFALSAPEFVGSGLAVSGVLQLIDHAFRTFRFRKLYMESPASSLSSYESAIRFGFVQEEARLTNHEWNGENYDDLVFLSITTEMWDESKTRLLPS